MSKDRATSYSMFVYDENMTSTILEYCRARLAADPVPLGYGGAHAPQLARLDGLLSEEGNDPRDVLRVFDEDLLPSILALESPASVAFIPHAPTHASRLFDMVVSSASLSATHWFEGAGAIAAENQALRFLANAAGMPPAAGGCFVSGGTLGNVSALFVAREQYRERFQNNPRRPRIAVSSEAHASIGLALRLLDVEALEVPTDDHRFTGAALGKALAADPHPDDLVAVVATAGTTNAGIVDDLDGIAEIAGARNLWFHVDGAYGAAALIVPELRERFRGIERADSLVVDPHKWLFAPNDCGALLYREPDRARAVLVQQASYLAVVSTDATDAWSPGDYAVHLTRRARGLPFWFSLAVHGIRAYRDAIASSLALTGHCAQVIESLPYLTLVREPELSVVLFRREGWGADDYEIWRKGLLESQRALVAPTTWEEAPTARLAFGHPHTTAEFVEDILASME